MVRDIHLLVLIERKYNDEISRMILTKKSLKTNITHSMYSMRHFFGKQNLKSQLGKKLLVDSLFINFLYGFGFISNFLCSQGLLFLFEDFLS